MAKEQEKLDRERRLQDSLEKSLDNVEKAYDRLERTKTRLSDQDKEAYKLTDLEIQQNKKLIEQVEAENELLVQNVKTLEAEAAALDALGALTPLEASRRAELGGLIRDEKDARDAHTAAMEDEIEVYEKLNEAQEKVKNAQEEVAKGAEKLVETVLGLNNGLLKALDAYGKSKLGIKGYVKELWKQVKAQGAAKIAGGQALKLSEGLTAGVMGLAKAMLQLAFAQDEAVSGFMKATGASYGFAAQIPSINADLHAVGISAQDAGKAFGGLYNTFTDFTEISPGMRGEMARNVALLQELGVSADVSGKILDTAMRSLGLHSKAANKMLLEVVGIAKALRMPFTKVARDFVSVAPKITKYGSQMMEVFKGLEIQSKRTGLEMSKLIGVTEQFDTFEGAGRAVGRLNAILGGPYLNAIDMLNATDEERIDILQRLTEQSGLQFDELNRYEQMNIAKAMGTDVDTARRMFGQSRAEFDKQALAQQRLAAMARESQTLIDQLKFAFQSALVGMRPMIEEFIVPFIHGLGELNSGSGKFRKELGKLYDQIMMWSKIIGLVMLVGGIILSVVSGGTFAVAGIPIAMAGAKMLGIGLLGSGITGSGGLKGKMGDLSAAAKADTISGEGSIVARGRARNRAFRRDYEAVGGDIPYVPGMVTGGLVGAQIPGFHMGGIVGRYLRSHAKTEAHPPSSMIRMNEGGEGETAIVPYGTYIANASDTKQVMTLTAGLMKEVKGLRADINATLGNEFTFNIEEDPFAHAVARAMMNPIVRRAMNLT